VFFLGLCDFFRLHFSFCFLLSLSRPLPHFFTPHVSHLTFHILRKCTLCRKDLLSHLKAQIRAFIAPFIMPLCSIFSLTYTNRICLGVRRCGARASGLFTLSLRPRIRSGAKQPRRNLQGLSSYSTGWTSGSPDRGPGNYGLRCSESPPFSPSSRQFQDL